MTGSSPKLKIAVIGAGYGRSHVANFAANPHAEVVVLWSRQPETARRVAAEFKIPQWTTDWHEALALHELDAVAIATPVEMHAAIALAAIARGCHVLCEKPLALNIDECRTLLEAAESARVVHAVNFDWRMVPDARTLNDVIRDRAIGMPQQAHLKFLANTQPAEAPFMWRHDRALAGFGVLGDFHHVCDEIHWHFGPVSRVSANLRTLVATRAGTDGTRHVCDADDAVEFLALTTEGVSVTGALNRCAPQVSLRSTECLGSDGFARLSFPDMRDRKNTSLCVAGTGVVQASGIGEPGPPRETTQDKFIAAILDSGAAPESSFHDGLAACRLAEAMRESSDGQCWVALEPDYCSHGT